MKYLFLLSLIATCGASAFSQTVEMWGNVPVIEDAYGHKIAPDGSYSIGEAVTLQSAWGRDNETGKIILFEAASIGDGNSISKQHITVGTDKIYMKAAFLLPEEGRDPLLIKPLEKYSESFAHGINWDGTRLVAIVSNPNKSNTDEYHPDYQALSYLPVYCDLDPSTLEVKDEVFLPVPERDLFGLIPQYCTAEWINDAGDVILGQVIDNSGYFIYPIVYKQDSNGKWNYSLPSESLFNPDNKELPQYPKPLLLRPSVLDYIEDPEMKALFNDLLNQYNAGLIPTSPYDMLNPDEVGEDALMTQQEYNEYEEAMNEYENYIIYIYNPELEAYYDAFSRFLSQTTNFLQSSMAMNRAGTMIGQTKVVTRFSGKNPITYENPMIFNLEDKSYRTLGGDFDELEIEQILPDGTIIASTAQPGPTTPDLTPQHSYVCGPGSSEFVSIENYIQASNPQIYNWFIEYLKHDVPIGYDETGAITYKNMVVSGLVAVSDDFKAISGGVDGWSWELEDGLHFTYIMTGLNSPNAGVESLPIPESDRYIVFSMQGVKIIDTTDLSSLNSLPKGIYIINGKKTFLR